MSLIATLHSSNTCREPSSRCLPPSRNTPGILFDGQFADSSFILLDHTSPRMIDQTEYKQSPLYPSGACLAFATPAARRALRHCLSTTDRATATYSWDRSICVCFFWRGTSPASPVTDRRQPSPERARPPERVKDGPDPILSLFGNPHLKVPPADWSNPPTVKTSCLSWQYCPVIVSVARCGQRWLNPGLPHAPFMDPLINRLRPLCPGPSRLHTLPRTTYCPALPVLSHAAKPAA
jgi:hypothetical protein